MEENDDDDDDLTKIITLVPRLNKKPIQIQWEHILFGLDGVPLYITKPDLTEIIMGNTMLNIFVIQLWAM